MVEYNSQFNRKSTETILLVFIFNRNAFKNAIKYLLISGLIFFRDYS